MTSLSVSGRYADIGNLKIHYLVAGKGNPVVLLHGWPTSSYLWRKIIAPLAKSRKVIVPDLPGFGKSDKPLDVRYNFGYQASTLDRFLHHLNIKRTALVVHDIGGPIGAYWAIRNPGKVERVAILDTILHPDLPILMKLLFLMSHIGLVSRWLASPSGIATTMKLGVVNRNALSEEDIAAYQAPFADSESQAVLLKTLNDLDINKLKEIALKLPKLKVPIRIIYGKNDVWMASEMRRIKLDLPEADITAIPNCGHFLQEDQPELLGRCLSEFLA